MRRTTATLGALVLLVLAAAAPVSAATAACELTATPPHGPPGTEFVLSGSGYTPTRLILRQHGNEARVIDLDLADADPFEISFVATEEDAGIWTAIASIPGTECAGRTTMRVVLPDTATLGASGLPAAPDRLPILLVLAGLITLFLFASRSFLRRFA